MERPTPLRPDMPSDPEAQRRWRDERMIEAMVRLSTATEQLTGAVHELRQALTVFTARLEPAE